MKVKLLLSILLLAVIVVGSVVLTQEVLRVRTVVVLGCQQRNPQEVTALSGVSFGESIFKVDLDKVRENVQTSPYYQVESVTRQYPDKIAVMVHERQPRAIIEYLGSMIVMDEEGYILEVRSDAGSERCPTIIGMQASSFVVGQQVSSVNPMQLRVMTALLEEMEAQECAQLFAKINLESVEDMVLTTVEGVRIQFGSVEKTSDKLRWIRATLPKLTQMQLVGGTLYVAGGDSPTWIPPAGDNAQPVDLDQWPDGQAPQEPQEEETQEGEEVNPQEGIPQDSSAEAEDEEDVQ